MFKTVTFTAGSADERAFVSADKKHPVLKIMDAGYVSYALLELMHKSGSYFMLARQVQYDEENYRLLA